MWSGTRPRQTKIKINYDHDGSDHRRREDRSSAYAQTYDILFTGVVRLSG